MTSFLPLEQRGCFQIHGHRGCRGLLPENTIPAFLHALRLGVDVLEMDVVLSADQQVVVAHEPWLSARLGLSPTGQQIDPAHEKEFNLYQLPYEAIRASVVGTLPHPAFPEQQQLATYRPLLGEVFTAIEAACQQLDRAPVGYSIELKSTRETEHVFHPAPASFTAQVLAAIPEHLLSRTTLLCFDYWVLQAARAINPSIRVCLLIEMPFEPRSLFKELGFVPDVFGPSYKLLSEPVLAELRLLYPQLQVIPWTVNEVAAMVAMQAIGVDGITTDYPNRASATL